MVVAKYMQDKLAEVLKKDLTNISIHLRIVTTTPNFYRMFLENCHLFGKIEDIMRVVCYKQKGRHLDTAEKLFL